MDTQNGSEHGLGRTLIIANPAAQSGAAQRAAERIQRFLALYAHGNSTFEMVLTQGKKHATQLAAQAQGYDTVIALGGDGVVHETAAGILQKPRAERPVLGVIPVGSGNDFARTLGIAPDLVDHVEGLLGFGVRMIDAGRVDYLSSEENGARCTDHFVETFSFGLDAAIALDTVDRRRRTDLTGTLLYTASGLDVFCRRFRSYPVEVTVDSTSLGTIESLIFAVQNGPTYGSGFSICPKAQPDDGLLDICYAAGRVPRAVALPLFLRAKNGGHVTSRLVRILRARKLDLVFGADDYPIQVDGEQIRAARAEISIEPGALRVLAPQKSPV